MNSYDVVILGAGAAGLMCAITAGGRRRKVLVLERANKVGKKILMSGGGRCNFTNLYVSPERYRSENPHFCKSALSRYTQWDFLDLVKRHGIPYHEKTQGQLFCDRTSKDILNMLLDECKKAGVEIRTDCDISVVEANTEFRIVSGPDEISCESLVVATGGLSIPTLGGSGFGYDIARQFGLAVLPTCAGLVPFVFTDKIKEMCERLSGISINATVSCDSHSFTDKLLFTHRGLSGPAILQLSSWWSEGQRVRVDLLPDQDGATLLKSLKSSNPRAKLRTLLSKSLPARLVNELENLWWPAWVEVAVGEIPDHVLLEIAARINEWQLKPAGTEGYRTAEVTQGGVDTRELSSKTLECKSHPGLYFIGEIVDVTGELGGFNFQWAWSSGYAAGRVV